jgi:quercetin dioxygenase-like cupin family protein
VVGREQRQASDFLMTQVPDATMTTPTDDRTISFLGNNEITVLLSERETAGAYCVLQLTIQPRGGATALHTDRWIETFHVIDGAVEWTLERDGHLGTWIAGPGETVVVPVGAKHRFSGAGDRPSRLLTVGPADFERFFRALAGAWSGPYDRQQTPKAIGPVFAAFGMQLCEP